MSLKPSEPFPDEIFYSIFEIEDHVERQKFIERVRGIAKDQKRAAEFSRLFKRFLMDYQNRMRQSGGWTEFTDQPVRLSCGEWKADDQGIRALRFGKDFQPVTVYACSHPVLPIEILKNVDTSEERITLAYYKSAAWQRITVNRSVCANTNKIVDALSQFGIEVTSENAKNMVRYISDCVGYNPIALAPKKSINRLGWVGAGFTPYEEDIRYEGEPEYEPIFRNVRQEGKFATWKGLCERLREICH